jgi:F-type H+-transporting ATPase subunit gamma
MANLKEIKNRIASVSTTQQITSAMKMVSAAKFKKAQDAILHLRPYALKLNELLSDIIDSLHGDETNVYGKRPNSNRILMVVITSNRGLCGGFNANVIKRVLTRATGKYSAQMRHGQLDLYILGKKGGDILSKKNFTIYKSKNEIYDNLNYENSSIIANEIIQLFLAGKYSHIELIYNQFRNAAVQEVASEQFLPVPIVNPNIPSIDKKDKYETYADFIFEPGKEYITEKLIPKSLRIQLFKALLDSHASEHGARMTAMHKATDNAADLIRELSLEYNKARQAAITKEILEIVSGAEALRS